MDEQSQAIKDELKYYQKIAKADASDEVEALFDLMLKTVAEKMLWTFTTGKDGDNVKSWEEFCRVRGEIVARLHPIQEVKSADYMVDHLKQQLDQYYNNS